MIEIKKSFVVNILCLIIAFTVIIVEHFLKQKFDFSCSEILMNNSNPNSYVNRITKPFLIRLIHNASQI